ncbi:hypothetical protein ACLKMH_04635 [Psychromonas sp. KJ10-10]
MTASQSQHLSKNFSTIVTEGRNPEVTLEIDGQTQSVATWGNGSLTS